jgi:L-rhamnose mutarotase
MCANAARVIRKAFRMSVHPGRYEEYERRHAPIWRELEDVLIEHGVQRYSIFLDESDGSLFGYVEIEDAARWEAIAETAACRRWWAYMREVMPVNSDDSPRSVELREVFNLPSRDRDSPGQDT